MHILYFKITYSKKNMLKNACKDIRNPQFPFIMETNKISKEAWIFVSLHDVFDEY